MQVFDNALDKHKIIMNASLFYESALIRRDQIWEARGMPKGKDLGEDLGDVVHQTNGSKVAHSFCHVLFWEQHNIHCVKEVESVSSKLRQLSHRLTYVRL
jgi:hypothetical protein